MIGDNISVNNMEITNKQKGELGESLVSMALMNMGCYQHQHCLSKLQKCRFNLYECQQWQECNDSSEIRNNP